MSVGSRRLARMERQHGRSKKQPAFNIVSLMDIFTILVFFLLVNTSDITPLPNPKGIEMPESIAETTPHESVVVMLSNEQVMLQGEEIISVEEVMKEDSQELAIFVRIMQGSPKFHYQ